MNLPQVYYVKIIDLTKILQSDIDPQREIQNIQKLQHPHIVQYFGHEIKDNKLSIVMGYVEGLTLETFFEIYKPLLQLDIVMNIMYFTIILNLLIFFSQRHLI